MMGRYNDVIFENYGTDIKKNRSFLIMANE